MIAHGNALAVDRCVHVLAGLWIVPGAFPLADILELRALCSVPCMHGCAARRIEQVMAGVVHDRAESDWRERRAERGQAHGRDRPIQRLRGDCQTMQVGCLALVRRHAVGGEALDVLDRMHAFAHCEPHVLGRSHRSGNRRRLSLWCQRRRQAPSRSCPRSSLHRRLPEQMRPCRRQQRMPRRALPADRPSHCRRRPIRNPAHRCRAGSVRLPRPTQPCRAIAKRGGPTEIQPADMINASTATLRSLPPLIRLDRHR